MSKSSKRSLVYINFKYITRLSRKMRSDAFGLGVQNLKTRVLRSAEKYLTEDWFGDTKQS